MKNFLSREYIFEIKLYIHEYNCTNLRKKREYIYKESGM